MYRHLYDQLKNFHGSLMEVSRRTGITIQSVTFILRDGKWDNPQVAQTAREVLTERKAAIAALESVA